MENFQGVYNTAPFAQTHPQPNVPTPHNQYHSQGYNQPYYPTQQAPTPFLTNSHFQNSGGRGRGRGEHQGRRGGSHSAGRNNAGKGR